MNRSTIEPELECSICREILLHPVSITCGHTFCKDCLLPALQNKPMCPLCRSPTFLQSDSLNENITLKALIETHYSQFLNARKEKKEIPLLDEVHSARDESREGIGGARQQQRPPQREAFKNFFTLKLLDLHKNYLFPYLNDIVKVSCDFSSELFAYICQDKKFICLPKSCPVLPTPTFIAQCHEILSVTPGKMKMEIKILDRVLVENVSCFKNENDELLQKFSLPSNFSFLVSNGRFLEDSLPPSFLLPLSSSSSAVEEGLKEIGIFFRKHLGNLNSVSPNTFVRILHKIGEININDLLDQNGLQEGRNLSKFSFLIAGSLRAKEDEKRQMFETTNVVERLDIARRIIHRLDQFTDPLQIFDVDIPTQKLFSLKYSVVLILVVIGALILNRLWGRNGWMELN